ncbi:MAG: hypothetical protein HZB40_06360 [Rhodocyclales bacterium]|nr:hypothetical protein [Rhodocyclales bacterium]
MRPDELPDPIALLTSALAVMTHFIQTGCPRQGALVRRQLDVLQSYPDHLVPPPFKATVRRLHGAWELLLAGRAPCGAPAAPASRTLH